MPLSQVQDNEDLLDQMTPDEYSVRTSTIRLFAYLTQDLLRLTSVCWTSELIPSGTSGVGRDLHLGAFGRRREGVQHCSPRQLVQYITALKVEANEIAILFGHALLRSSSYFSSTTLLISVPTPCETSTRNSSPSCSKFLGSDDHPTPAGVPVRMMVPGLRVVPCDRNDTIFGTVKIKSLKTAVRVRKHVFRLS
jgi:hypothetical protein